jgi:hypothetical protein
MRQGSHVHALAAPFRRFSDTSMLSPAGDFLELMRCSSCRRLMVVHAGR